MEPLDVRGLAQGMALFHVEMVVHYKYKDNPKDENEWDATLAFPTFYTVGGNEDDAIGNAVRIIRPQSVPGMYAWSASAVNADHNSSFKVVTARFPE